MTVVILGAGIGGLTTAYYLLKLTNYKIIVVESSNRIGGWIRSERYPNGLILEQGARTLRPKGEPGLNTLNLIDELKLSNCIQPILSKDPAAKNRFIYVNGKLHILPSSLLSIFRKVPPFSKSLFSSIFHDLRSKAKYVEDDSIYEFVKRRFGKEVADYAISPLICGICGGDAKSISVNFLLSDFFDNEQEYGSVIKGLIRPWNWKKKHDLILSDTAKRALKEKWSSYSITGGLETLPQALSTQLEENGVTIMKNSTAHKLNFRKKMILINENEMPFDFIVNTLPTYSFVNLIYKDHFHILGKELLKIPYTSIITVNLVYQKEVLNLNGFGFLVPPSENLPILGIVFDSCYAPFENWTVLTVMMGGHAFDKFFSENCSHDYIMQIATENVEKILKIKDSANLSKVSIMKNCIPQHTVGHKKRMSYIFNYIEQENLPLFLVGNAYKGTGINDIILSAKKTAESIKNYRNEKKDEYETPRYVVQYL